MTSLFHFEEKIHRKHLSRAETIPLLFLRLLCHVLEHLGFPAKPYREQRRVCEATFTIEKWQFMPRAPHLPENPPSEADPQIDPPQVQQPTVAPTQEPYITMPVAPASDPVPTPHVPAAHSSAIAPTAPTGPNSYSPPVASIHITCNTLNYTLTVL